MGPTHLHTTLVDVLGDIRLMKLQDGSTVERLTKLVAARPAPVKAAKARIFLVNMLIKGVELNGVA